MANGKIKWFNESSGHGFIEIYSGKDVYVHYTSFLGRAININDSTFVSGTPVRFDLVETEQGPEAYNVEILENTGS